MRNFDNKSGIQCTLGGGIYVLYALTIVLTDWISFLIKSTYVFTLLFFFIYCYIYLRVKSLYY